MTEPTGDIPLGLCQCGCGQPTTISKQNHTKYGYVKGQPKRFIDGHGSRRGGPSSRYTHGLTRHPLYPTWAQMMQRCEDAQHHAYKNYGGRGIKVCARWHDVALFVEDIERDLGPRPKGWTLDRILNDGNYKPGNVRWASRKMQSENRRPVENQSAQSRESWAKRTWRTEVCERCGSEFQTRSSRHRVRYCPECRRPKWADRNCSTSRICHWCGTSWPCVPSSRQRHCSRACAISCRHAGGCPQQ